MSDTAANRETIAAAPLRTINSSEIDSSSLPSTSRRQYLLRNSDTQIVAGSDNRSLNVNELTDYDIPASQPGDLGDTNRML